MRVDGDELRVVGDDVRGGDGGFIVEVMTYAKRREKRGRGRGSKEFGKGSPEVA